MTSRGHGKVILLGEHAVVYGKPAIAGALARGVTATAERSDRATSLTVPAWNARAEVADGSPLGEALAALVAALDRPGAFAVTAHPEIPGGAGLGASAALGVAAARAIAECDGHPLDPESLRRAALAWETVFHGNPSGIDAEVAASGIVGIFVRGEGLHPLRLSRPIPVAIGDSGERSSTRDMVASLAREKDRNPAKVAKLLDGIESLVRNAAHAIEADDLAELGTLMNLNQTLLAAVLLSSEHIENLCAAARAAGAYGAKLTGAGGGGSVVAVADDPDAVVAAWARAGYSGFSAALGAP